MKKLLPILLIACFTACAPYVSVVDIAPSTGTDFSKYKTFDFYQTTTSGTNLPAALDTNLPRIKTALASQLARLGMTQTSSNPDLLVNIGLVLDEKAQTRETNLRTDPPMYMGQRNYTWQAQEIVTGYYTEGTLDVHLVDPSTKSLVWQGAVSNVLPEKEAKIPEVIDLAATSLFEGFPNKTVAPRKRK